jgi:hypothetical protein
MTTNTQDMIEFEFARHGNRQPCHVCGGVTEKFEICAEWKTEEGFKGEKFRVCARCLKEDEIDERLLGQVILLQNQALYLECLIGRLKVPSHEELNAEEERRHAQGELRHKRDVLWGDRYDDLRLGAINLLKTGIDLDDREACRRVVAQGESELYLDVLIDFARSMKRHAISHPAHQRALASQSRIAANFPN